MSENNFLVFTKKQTTWLTAGSIFVITLAFTIGYIIGQRRTLHDFSEQVNDDSFADKVRYSMYSSYKSLTNQSDIDIDSEAELDLEEEKSKTEPAPVIQENKVEPIPEQKQITKKYSAQLCGFGTMMAAKKFVDRVKRIGVPVTVKEKISRGKKGKKIVWYQAVTMHYDNKQELLKDVEKVQLSEKLQKVQLIEE